MLGGILHQPLQPSRYLTYIDILDSSEPSHTALFKADVSAGIVQTSRDELIADWTVTQVSWEWRRPM